MRTEAEKKAEKQLIKSCVRGNSSAQANLYRKHSPKMFSICLRYSSDYHQAEDILQEGFVKIYRNLAKFRGDGSFEGWMRRIFVNTAIEKFRKKNYLYPILDSVTPSQVSLKDEAIGSLAAQDLMSLVNNLSPGYKTVFNLYAIEGFTHKEIAQKLGISEGTSKSQLARARYILQDKVIQLNQEKPSYQSEKAK